MPKKTPRKKRANAGPTSGLFATKKAKKAPQINIYSSEFNELQAEWDKKLAESGFRDIEQRATTPQGETLDFNTKSTYNLGRAYSPETEHYYRRLTNYLTFNAQVPDGYGGFIGPTKMQACKLYADGHSFRAILKQLQGRPGPALNLYSLSKLIKHFVNEAKTWNKLNHNGLDFIADL